jgi:hypothetical protein
MTDAKRQRTSARSDPDELQMSIQISSSFDAGNIEHVSTTEDGVVRLRIKPDPYTVRYAATRDPLRRARDPCDGSLGSS